MRTEFFNDNYITSIVINYLFNLRGNKLRIIGLRNKKKKKNWNYVSNSYIKWFLMSFWVVKNFSHLYLSHLLAAFPFFLFKFLFFFFFYFSLGGIQILLLILCNDREINSFQDFQTSWVGFIKNIFSFNSKRLISRLVLLLSS